MWTWCWCEKHLSIWITIIINYDDDMSNCAGYGSLLSRTLCPLSGHSPGGYQMRGGSLTIQTIVVDIIQKKIQD